MIINSREDIERGIRFLGTVEPRFARAAELTGPPPLRRRAEGFTSLLDMIVSQQVSAAAADSIWNRLKSAGYTDCETLCRCSEEDLRGCGLSRQKIRYAKALAEADLDYPALGRLSDADLVTRLTRLPGIGRWTAEIYGMFSLGRPDMFPAGDLALRESARILLGLDKRPPESELRRLALSWSPWRAVAARLLWSYYREAKKREGIR